MSVPDLVVACPTAPSRWRCERQSPRLLRRAAATSIGLLLAGAAPAAAQVYVPTEIGTFGGDTSVAHGINEAGMVVGYARNDAGHNRAFLYTGGVLTDLGTLGGADSQAFAINNTGQIVGFARTESGLEHAFRYAGGTMSDLGTLGGSSSYGFGINDSGQIVGGSTREGDLLYRAYRHQGGTMTDLGTLGGDLGSSEAFGIDADGTVVGWTSLLNLTQQAFVYRNDTISLLGTLGGNFSYAQAIRNGVIVGGSFEVGDAAFRAVRWSDGTIVNLGSLGTHPSSIAYGLNSTGQIVGRSDDGSDETARAFLHLGGTMIDLNDLLAPGSGWILQQARGMNDAGQIVGSGTFNGQTRGFILNLAGKIWANPAGGAFGAAQNWFTIGAPELHQPAAFPLDAAYTIGIGSASGSRSVAVSRGDVTFDVATGASYSVTEQIAVKAGARLSVRGSGVVSAAVISSQGALHLAGGEVKLRTGGGTSLARQLSFGGTSGAWTGRLDLADNGFVVDYDANSPVALIRELVRSGRGAAAAWDGTGIASSLADASSRGVGYAESAALYGQFPAPFGGLLVDNTSVLIRLTRYGDANLDGNVNLRDFNVLAANFGQQQRFWHMGDFNYDGLVNLADFNLLAGNFGLVAAGPEVTPADWAALASAVPEPGVLGLVLAGLGALRRPRMTRFTRPTAR